MADRTRTAVRIAEVAARQFGLITRAQALAEGLTERIIDHKLASGAWLRVYRGVYLIAGTPASFEQRVLAACLRVGGDVAASHETAGVLWGLIERRQPLVEVTVPAGRHPVSDRFAVHRSRCGVERVERTDGIPVTSVARTLLDLCSRLGRSELEDALDEALRRNLVTVRELESRIRQPGGRRRRGDLASLLAEQGSAKPRGSVREKHVLAMLRRAGLPEPVRQYEVRRGGRVIARPDLAYPDQKIAIEYDSRQEHSSRRAYERDKARTFELQLAGWVVPPLSGGDFDREQYVCGALRRLLWERGHPDVVAPNPP